MSRPLTIAVPKGRILKTLAPLFESAGIDTTSLLATTASSCGDLDGKPAFLLLASDDASTYVEYGAPQTWGSAGAIRCRASLRPSAPRSRHRALPHGSGWATGAVALEVPRIATKFQRIATEHFAKKGIQAEVIYVGGSVELSPLVGLSDLIVDLVETGTTLKENDLVEREVICEISSLLIANRAQYKLRHAEIAPLIQRLASHVNQA
ncbi:MAG: ATP phosphoribosyltransferase [Polyangiaceae bacterium]